MSKAQQRTGRGLAGDERDALRRASQAAPISAERGAFACGSNGTTRRDGGREYRPVVRRGVVGGPDGLPAEHRGAANDARVGDLDDGGNDEAVDHVESFPPLGAFH